MIEVVLIQDCVRVSGQAKIEVELKEGTDIVSSFYIEAFIEKTSKEDITSDNASIYIEEYEKAIENLQKESEELLENIRQARNNRNRKYRTKISKHCIRYKRTACKL